MLKVTPNFLKNSDKIVSLAKEHDSLFVKRSGEDAHTGFIPGVCSRFQTLKDEHMSSELKAAIFDEANEWDEDTRDFWEFIQIQKYEPGDYIVAHRDSYRVRKLHLITLTSGKFDGLVCEKDKELIFIPDEAGQYVDFPYTAAHYVSPVKELRYSLVMGI